MLFAWGLLSKGLEPTPPKGAVFVGVLPKTDDDDKELELSAVGLDPKRLPEDVCGVEAKLKLWEPGFCKLGSSLIVAGLRPGKLECVVAFDSVVEPQENVLATLAD